jgi:hypothetical protein
MATVLKVVVAAVIAPYDLLVYVKEVGVGVDSTKNGPDAKA